MQVTLPTGATYQGMANLGHNPTFTDVTGEVLESHLFAFQANLYGQHLQVAFQKFIRTEKKFAGVEALKAQMQLDESVIRTYFQKAKN